METHELFVEFNQYCQTCKYEKLNKNEAPCNECLEHLVTLIPINLTTMSIGPN